MILEVVVYTIESALNAQKGGADRVELCANPGDGGTTPSYGTMEVVRQALGIDVYAMIRPRGGDFVYSSEEYFAMRRDIEMCKRASMDGVVFGVLKPDGTLDKNKCKKLIELARPMKVTCHRAFDMTHNLMETLEDCIEVGFDRILTSGGQAQAVLGTEMIATLIQQSNGRIAIMPGSGVNENNVTEIVKKTGAREIHFSAVAYRESQMQFRNEAIAGMGSAQGSEFKLRTVDPELVKKIRELSEKK
jgi:copper homeostasis protein